MTVPHPFVGTGKIPKASTVCLSPSFLIMLVEQCSVCYLEKWMTESVVLFNQS